MTTGWMKVYFDLNQGRFNVHFADEAPEVWMDRHLLLTKLVRKGAFVELEKPETGIFRKLQYDCTIVVTEDEILTTVPSMAANAILTVVRRWIMEQFKNKVPTKRVDDDERDETESDGPVRDDEEAGDQLPERSSLEKLRLNSDAAPDGEEEAEATESNELDEGELDQVPLSQRGSSEGETQDS